MQSPPHTHGPRSPPQALLPSRLPPPWSFIDDVAPFLQPLRTLYRKIRNRMDDAEGQHRRLRKKQRTMREDNLPLQIQLYFSSYVSMLQRRKILDHSTTDSLIRIIDEFQHTLTSLEKIVTTVSLPHECPMHC